MCETSTSHKAAETVLKNIRKRRGGCDLNSTAHTMIADLSCFFFETIAASRTTLEHFRVSNATADPFTTYFKLSDTSKTAHVFASENKGGQLLHFMMDGNASAAVGKVPSGSAHTINAKCLSECAESDSRKSSDSECEERHTVTLFLREIQGLQMRVLEMLSLL